MNAGNQDVLIVGAGIMGASLAYYLARQGVRSLVVDRSGPASEASGANAGMIGPSGGIPGKTLPLYQLSGDLYDKANEELDAPINFVRGGRLMLAHSKSDVEEREAYVRDRTGLGIDVEMLYGNDVLDLEPLLSEKVVAAAYAPNDGQVDPFRATVSFLKSACRLGAEFRGGVSVDEILVNGGRVVGIRAGSEQIYADTVVIAAGAWSGEIGKTAGIDLPVFPGKGQMLVSAPVPRLTTRVLRAVVVGVRQMTEGNLVFGSEVELTGFEKSVDPFTIGRYAKLMKDTVPSIAEVEFERAWAGLRPMTSDGLPIIGPAPGISGLFLLTGHGRSGMTYGPGSAFTLAELLISGETTIPIDHLGLERFSN